MERCHRPTHRRGSRDSPSFSSSLLDAIYRSIDETNGKAAAVMDDKHTGVAPDPPLSPALSSTTTGKKHSATAAWATDRPMLRRKHETSDLHLHNNYPFLISTTSSSSDGSSCYGGFSSDADSAIASSSWPKPIRTARSDKIQSDLPPPPPSHHQEKKKPSPISIPSRFRNLRKARASPGARLANFLNGLFSGAASQKKAKIAAPATPAVAGDESACSSASSYTRSCLSKIPPSGGRSSGKRSVRFGPVNVVDDDVFQSCGRRSLYGDADPPAARERESRRLVEELLRGMEAEEDEDEDDDGAESDSSSDLFELENLKALGCGYRDELPVYETTHIASNRAIAHGLIM